MNSPKITVIVPLYNKVAEVERAIQSILQQTITNYELLVIDGGSTDGSLDIISHYLEDVRLTLLYQKSKGLPAARNEAIKASHGDLIAFLDADDEWHPDFLETILHLYQTYPGAGIYATAYERCAIVACKPSPVKGLPDGFEGYLPSYFKVYADSGYPPFCPCSVALSRDVFDKVGYFNEDARLSEDLEMWVRVAYSFPIVFTSKIHSRYHLYASNKMSLDYYPIEVLPPVEYLESIPIDEIKKHPDYQNICNALDYMYLVTAYFNIGAGNRTYARNALSKSKLSQYNIMRIGLMALSLSPKIVGINVIRIYSSLPYFRDKLLCGTEITNES